MNSLFKTPKDRGDALKLTLRNGFSIWLDEVGFYWYDSGSNSRSFRHFADLHDAIEDCRPMLGDTTPVG